jgi:2-keto-3-deoxy-L-rhamnonate aldolase RhmA
MRENTLKRRLYAGKAPFGVMGTFPSPPVVEMRGHLGFDWILLEEVEAIENLPEMVTVPGVDVFFIGSGDLSQSMGLLIPKFLGLGVQYFHSGVNRLLQQSSTYELEAPGTRPSRR